MGKALGARYHLAILQVGPDHQVNVGRACGVTAKAHGAPGSLAKVVVVPPLLDAGPGEFGTARLEGYRRWFCGVW